LPTKNSQRLLDRLDDAKRRFEKRDAETVVATLTALARLKLDPESLRGSQTGVFAGTSLSLE